MISTVDWWPTKKLFWMWNLFSYQTSVKIFDAHTWATQRAFQSTSDFSKIIQQKHLANFFFSLKLQFSIVNSLSYHTQPMLLSMLHKLPPLGKVLNDLTLRPTVYSSNFRAHKSMMHHSNIWPRCIYSSNQQIFIYAIIL